MSPDDDFEYVSRSARLSVEIRATPTFNPVALKAIADGLRDVADRFGTRGYQLLDIERLGIEFIAEAVRYGAFAGEAWLGFRTKLADRPHLLNALVFLEESDARHQLPYEISEILPQESRAVQVASIFADLIGLFATGDSHSPPHAIHPEVSRPAELEPAEDVPLSERQQGILMAMLELGAFDSDSRRSMPAIAKNAEPRAIGLGPFKKSLADLKRKRMVLSREGRGGGCWLTPTGIARANKLQS